MPTSIPFDPALVMGNVVADEYFTGLDAISAAQAPVDAAQETLDELITLRRSLDMTVQELLNLNVDPGTVLKSIDDVNKQLTAAASTYAEATTGAEPAISAARKNVRAIHHGVESPIDYNRTQIKKMALSADSLKMDVQYFSLNKNDQHAANHVS